MPEIQHPPRPHVLAPARPAHRTRSASGTDSGKPAGSIRTGKPRRKGSSLLLSSLCPRCPRSVPGAVPGTFGRPACRKSLYRQGLRRGPPYPVPCPRPFLPCATLPNCGAGCQISRNRRRIDGQAQASRPALCSFWCSRSQFAARRSFPPPPPPAAHTAPAVPAGSAPPAAVQAQGAGVRLAGKYRV